jgi:hypothetical protein
MCELCGRDGVKLTRHHLLPQCRQDKPRFRKFHTRQEGRERIALICSACHSAVHSIFTEKELELSFNTVESLKLHPELGRFLRWIAGKPPGFQPLSRKRRVD